MIEGLLDSRNKDLFSDISQVIRINIELIHNTDVYTCYSEQYASTIFVPASNISSSAFTHELLHLYLRSKGVFIGARLTRKLSSSANLSSIYTPLLLDHISNSLDHMKMLPIFLSLGYDDHEFIIDYYEDKCPMSEIKLLEKEWTIPPLKNHLEFYLEKYFAIQACPNPKLEYLEQLKTLEQLEPNLFKINQELIQNWQRMSLQEDSEPEKKYIDIGEEYIVKIKKWHQNLPNQQNISHQK